MITQEQIDITPEVVIQIERFPETVDLMMDLICEDDCHCSSSLNFVNETIKRHKNLLLMLDIADIRYRFIINATIHYTNLLKENALNRVDTYISRELAQRDIKELFKYYNSIKIEIPESYVF